MWSNRSTGGQLKKKRYPRLWGVQFLSGKAHLKIEVEQSIKKIRYIKEFIQRKRTYDKEKI